MLLTHHLFEHVDQNTKTCSWISIITLVTCLNNISLTIMTRATRVLAVAAAVSLVYALVLFSVLPIPFLSKDLTDQMLPVLPWWLLVSFGAYSLWTLGWNVMTIRDCPEAYYELMNEIGVAKSDLRSKGVTVD